MATPKNKGRKYGKRKTIAFKRADGTKVTFKGRERKPTGAHGPPSGGTACRDSGGRLKRCEGGSRRPARQGGLFGGKNKKGRS